MAQTDYEQLADRYDEDRERFAVPRDPVIEQLLAGGPARVLDLGCGTGRWLTAQAAAFVDAGLDLIGVDPSVGMLHAARSKRVPCLVCARAEELPLRGRTVDYVVTSFAFHHFVDKERALDEVTRLLRPDGVLRMVNIEPTTADRWWVHRFFPETRALDATRFWTPDRIFESLERRGFHVEIDVDTTVEELDPAVVLADAERRVISQLAMLDDEPYARGLADLRAFAASASSPLDSITPLLRLVARRR